MARRLNKDEGILSGGSAGAILTGAMRAAKKLKKGDNCVFILPDSVRNYLTKFLDDEWMVSHGCMEEAVKETPLRPKPGPVDDYDPEAAASNEFQRVDEPWKPKVFK